MKTKKQETVTSKEIKTISKKFKSAIASTINPFKKDIDKSKFFNIRTGFIATEETEKYSLSIFNNGKMKRNSFINECAEDETRFSKPIKKTKIVKFAISNFQKKNKITKCIKCCKHSRHKIYFW